MAPPFLLAEGEGCLLGQGFFDPADRLGEHFLAGCIRKADAVVVAEGRTGYQTHVCLGEQVETQVVRGVDRGAAQRLTLVIGNIGEDVESAVRRIGLQSRDFGQFFQYQLATSGEYLDHRFDHRLGVGIQCSDGCLLCYGIGTRGYLSLEVLAGFGDPGCCADKADAPSGHRVGFGQPVYHDGLRIDFREFGDGGVSARGEVDVFVDLVRDDCRPDPC